MKTVPNVGKRDGIRRWADEDIDINLTLSTFFFMCNITVTVSSEWEGDKVEI